MLNYNYLYMLLKIIIAHHRRRSWEFSKEAAGVPELKAPMSSHDIHMKEIKVLIKIVCWASTWEGFSSGFMDWEIWIDKGDFFRITDCKSFVHSGLIGIACTQSIFTSWRMTFKEVFTSHQKSLYDFLLCLIISFLLFGNLVCFFINLDWLINSIGH